MPESNPTKTCTKCQESKPLEEFYRDKRAVDGRQFRCKACQKEDGRAFLNTPAGRESNRRSVKKYQTTEKFTVAHKRYRDANREVLHDRHREWRNTEGGKEHLSKYRKDHPEEVAARHAVHRAVIKGVIPHISTQACKECGKPAEHWHHKSYLPEHWLSVDPFCSCCHQLHHQIA